MSAQFVSIGTPNDKGVSFLMTEEMKSEKLEFQVGYFLGNVIMSRKDFDLLKDSLSRIGVTFQEKLEVNRNTR